MGGSLAWSPYSSKWSVWLWDPVMREGKTFGVFGFFATLYPDSAQFLSNINSSLINLFVGSVTQLTFSFFQSSGSVRLRGQEADERRHPRGPCVFFV